MPESRIQQTDIEGAQDQALQQALDLVKTHFIDLVNSADGTEIATVRLLADRHMITSDAVLDARIARDRSMHRSINHIPVGVARERERIDYRYITWLESALTAALDEIDAVSDLAGVKRTAKGQRLIQRAGVVRRKWQDVKRVWTSQRNSPATPAP